MHSSSTPTSRAAAPIVVSTPVPPVVVATSSQISAIQVHSIAASGDLLWSWSGSPAPLDLGLYDPSVQDHLACCNCRQGGLSSEGFFKAHPRRFQLRVGTISRVADLHASKPLHFLLQNDSSTHISDSNGNRSRFYCAWRSIKTLRRLFVRLIPLLLPLSVIWSSSTSRSPSGSAPRSLSRPASFRGLQMSIL